LHQTPHASPPAKIRLALSRQRCADRTSCFPDIHRLVFAHSEWIYFALSVIETIAMYLVKATCLSFLITFGAAYSWMLGLLAEEISLPAFLILAALMAAVLVRVGLT
jgi:hypothetical protein